MQRRFFVSLLFGAANWPLNASAQQKAMPVVGYLHGGSPVERERQVVAFEGGIAETGFVVGRDVVIEYRWAEGRYDQLPAMAADLVRRQVAVIFGGGPPAALAVKAATMILPVVFITGDDPVTSGLVERFNRPGGNVTGLHVFLHGLE